MSELQEILRRRLRRTEPDKFGEQTPVSDIDRRIQEAKKASGAAKQDPVPRALPRPASLRDALIDGEADDDAAYRSERSRGGNSHDVSSLADMEQELAQERRERDGDATAAGPVDDGTQAAPASPGHEEAQDAMQPSSGAEEGAPGPSAEDAAVNGSASGEEDLRDIREFLAQGDDELAFLSDSHEAAAADGGHDRAGGDGVGEDGAEQEPEAEPSAAPATSASAAPTAATLRVGTADLDARAVAGDAGMTEEQLAAAAAGLFGDRRATGDGSSDGEEGEEDEGEEEDGAVEEDEEGEGEGEEDSRRRGDAARSGRVPRHSRDTSCLSVETHPLAALAGELVASSTPSEASGEGGGADATATAIAAAEGGASAEGQAGVAARVTQLDHQVVMQRALLLEKDQELMSLRSQLAQALRSIAEADAVVARLLSEREGGGEDPGVPISPGDPLNPSESAGEEHGACADADSVSDADAPGSADAQRRRTLASDVSGALASFLDRTASLSASILGRRRQEGETDTLSSPAPPAETADAVGKDTRGSQPTAGAGGTAPAPAPGERRSRFRGLVAEGTGPNLRTLSSHAAGGGGGASRSGRRQHRRRRGSEENRGPRHAAAAGHWARHGAALGAGASAQLRRRLHGHVSAGGARGDAASGASDEDGREEGGEVRVPELAAPTAAAATGRVRRVFGPSPSPLVSTPEWLATCVELQVMGFAPERVREALRCVVEDREDAERVRQVAAAASQAEPALVQSSSGGMGSGGGGGGGTVATEGVGAAPSTAAPGGTAHAANTDEPARAPPAEGGMMTRRELLRPAVEVLLSLSLAAGDDKVTPAVIEALEDDGAAAGDGGGGDTPGQGGAGGEEQRQQQQGSSNGGAGAQAAVETGPRGGRPRTAADHGLFDASDDDGGDTERAEAGAGAAALHEGDNGAAAGASGGAGARITRVRSSLFEGIRSEAGPSDASDEAAALAANAQPSRRAETREEKAKREYNEFLDTLRRPECRDLVEDVGHFLVSVLHSQEGEEGDAEGEASRRDAAQSLPVRTRNFLEAINRKAAQHPVWREEGEEGMTRVREGFEQYVMGKLHAMAFSNTRELRRRDEALLRRMRVLQFVSMDHLELPEGARNEMALSLAQAELHRINSFRTPREKLNCVVNASQMVFNVLSLARDKAGARPGADDFLPVFIYVVLKAQVPRLPSNVKYIEQYRDPTDMMSRGGYCFVNLQSAAEFIMTLGPESLKIDRSEFERLYREREEAMLRAECAEAARSGPFAE